MWLILLYVSTFWCPTASAQLWSGILDSSRAIDWTTAGVTGGIPKRSQICATIEPYTGSSAAINDAIASCGDGQVVKLSAGTFNLSSNINFSGRSNITLRGAGPDLTILNITTGGCFYGPANICISGKSGVFNGNIPPSNIVNWSGGYSQGTTVITLSDTSNIAVGQYIILDQLDDTFNPAVTYKPFITCAAPWNDSACVTGRPPNRGAEQVVKVINKTASTVTISPGLFYSEWRSSQNPQAWWWGTIEQTATRNGVEDLAINNTDPSPTSHGMVQFTSAAESWVKNVRFNEGGAEHININQAANIEIRDSYFFGSKSGGASTTYGIGSSFACGIKMENNIFQQVTTPAQWGGTCGSVIGYNYAVNMPWAFQPNFMFNAFFPIHEAGAMLTLLEGNQTNGINLDLSHGSGALMTIFRNRFTGLESGRTQNTVPVIISGFIRFNNFVGNVLGTSGYHTNYENSNGPQGVKGNYDRSIYGIGYTGSSETNSAAGYDMITVTSLLRWGNYDYATATTRWNSAEIPTGNVVPASHSLPLSFYLYSKPSWFGSTPFPPIGPDVTGGNDPSGHAHDIPAKRCYTTVMGGPADGSGSIRPFNANACYGTTSTNHPPATPTGLRIS